MPFQKGHKKIGGRAKGGLNKKTLLAEDIAAKLNIDPLEVLLLFVKADWKKLGYKSASEICYSPQGIEFEKLTISPEMRLQAAKEAAKYLYSQKKSVELSADADKGFRITIEDYTGEET